MATQPCKKNYGHLAMKVHQATSSDRIIIKWKFEHQGVRLLARKKICTYAALKKSYSSNRNDNNNSP